MNSSHQNADLKGMTQDNMDTMFHLYSFHRQVQCIAWITIYNRKNSKGKSIKLIVTKSGWRRKMRRKMREERNEY